MTSPSQHNALSNVGFRFDNSYTDLPSAFYSELPVEPVVAPEMVILNKTLCDSLGLDFSSLSSEEQASLFSGNVLPNEASPFAQAYAGHQFGHFTILGDGRAHMLGEHIQPDGSRVDIQFKGSGRTPYSRRGDGRAILGPMLREYIIAEAMHALGIPTTRSLAVVTTGEEVLREAPLPGAILTRVASSHIRVGTFEFAASQPDESLISALLDYTVDRHFPELKDAPNVALAFLNAMMDRQADLITHWMRVGFIHGVMNTDNMTISGETIDYGPCSFMDAFNPNTVFSSIDHMGRYAYGNQPVIGQWNLARLASALLPLLDINETTAVAIAQEAIGTFPDLYKSKWVGMMRGKLGLSHSEPEDEALMSTLLDWMTTNKADYTNTFRALSQDKAPEAPHFECSDFQNWYSSWQHRLKKNTFDKQAALNVMQQHNPVVIPRNHKVEEALEAATEGDLTPFETLLTALKSPYQDSPSLKNYQAPPEPSPYKYQTFCGT
jgi:uncharacterized protein YdiU (UPF0061 family)